MSLIPRFYDVTSGRVLVDGRDVRTLNLEDLRRNIGIVFQESFLFSNTVAANIAFGHPEASREQIERAAKIASAHDFILGLPKGYDFVAQPAAIVCPADKGSALRLHGRSFWSPRFFSWMIRRRRSTAGPSTIFLTPSTARLLDERRSSLRTGLALCAARILSLFWRTAELFSAASTMNL